MRHELFLYGLACKQETAFYLPCNQFSKAAI
jgi:hypothetical protein